MGRTFLIGAISAIVISFAGCTGGQGGLPLPISAKTVVQIPFPYQESASGEKWVLYRDTSNRFVVQVWHEDNVVAQFPVQPDQGEGLDSAIILSGREYVVDYVHLNSDQMSGYVSLRMR